jgi:hypothetical protein
MEIQPQTRAELSARDESPTYQTSLLEVDRPEFLPLGIRRTLYLVGLAALVAAPFAAVQFPDYGSAFTTVGNLLGAVGLGTALANPSR